MGLALGRSLDINVKAELVFFSKIHFGKDVNGWI